jgi:hypothetical protein
MKEMSFFARLFGRNRRSPEQTTPDDGTVDTTSPFSAVGMAGTGVPQEVVMDGLPYDTVDAAIHRAVGPLVVELQAMRRMLGTIDRPAATGVPFSTQQLGAQTSGSATVDREIIERAIENALAHFYQLLRGREEFKALPVFLQPTADGNTALPLDPMLQHLLVVMHPLYPHMYTTLIVLPGTFTRVDRLSALPNGVRVHSLHINERKAAPGFMDALRALHRENSENLFLGKLTPAPGERSDYQLEYFRCTGSPIRNPDTEQFPGEQMMFFNDVPEPLVFRQHINGVEDVFSALQQLMQSTAAPDQSPDQGGSTI